MTWRLPRSTGCAADPTGKGGLAWYYSGLSYMRWATTAGIHGWRRSWNARPTCPRWLMPGWRSARPDTRARGGALETYRQLAGKPDSPQAPKALWQFAIQQDRAARSRSRALPRPGPPLSGGGRGLARVPERRGDLLPPRQLPGRGGYLARDGGQGRAARVHPAGGLLLARSRAARAGGPGCGRAGLAVGGAGGAGELLRAARGGLACRPRARGDGRPLHRCRAVAQGRACAGLGAEKTQIAAWLRTWAGQGTLNLPPAVLNDGDWQRGEALLELGFRSAALTQWERVRQRNEKNAWTLAALSLAFRDRGANRLSLLAAEQVVTLSGKLMREAPVALQRLAYPMPYDALIRAAAVKYKIDPRLLAAIIRQESRFGLPLHRWRAPRVDAGDAWHGGIDCRAVGPVGVRGAPLTTLTSISPSASYQPVGDALRRQPVHRPGCIQRLLTQVWRRWVSNDDDLFAAAININGTRLRAGRLVAYGVSQAVSAE